MMTLSARAVEEELILLHLKRDFEFQDRHPRLARLQRSLARWKARTIGPDAIVCRDGNDNVRVHWPLVWCDIDAELLGTFHSIVCSMPARLRWVAYYAPYHRHIYATYGFGWLVKRLVLRGGG